MHRVRRRIHHDFSPSTQWRLPFARLATVCPWRRPLCGMICSRDTHKPINPCATRAAARRAPHECWENHKKRTRDLRKRRADDLAKGGLISLRRNPFRCFGRLGTPLPSTGLSSSLVCGLGSPVDQVPCWIGRPARRRKGLWCCSLAATCLTGITVPVWSDCAQPAFESDPWPILPACLLLLHPGSFALVRRASRDQSCADALPALLPWTISNTA